MAAPNMAAPMAAPSAGPTMTNVTNVVVNQPGPAANPLLLGVVQGNREWSSGLCGCCEDILGVVKACCCMDCLICSLNSRTGECFAVHYLVPGALTALRTRIRTLGGIRGSIFTDCLVLNFCFPMAICQMDRELKAMGL